MTVLSPVEIRIWKEVIQVTERWGSFLNGYSSSTIDHIGWDGWGQCSRGKTVNLAFSLLFGFSLLFLSF